VHFPYRYIKVIIWDSVSQVLIMSRDTIVIKGQLKKLYILFLDFHGLQRPHNLMVLFSKFYLSRILRSPL